MYVRIICDNITAITLQSCNEIALRTQEFCISRKLWTKNKESDEQSRILEDAAEWQLSQILS